MILRYLGLRAIAELGRALGSNIKTVAVLASPDRNAGETGGVIVDQVKIYRPPGRPFTLSTEEGRRQILKIVDEHRPVCSKKPNAEE